MPTEFHWQRLPRDKVQEVQEIILNVPMLVLMQTTTESPM